MPLEHATSEAIPEVEISQIFSSVVVDGDEFIFLTNLEKATKLRMDECLSLLKAVREHHPSGIDLELFRKVTFAGIVVKGTKGAAVIDELKPQLEDYVIAKTRFSAFFGTNLHLVLQSAGIQNPIFTGIQTPNCIRQAVFDAIALDYPSVVFLSDVIAAYKPKVHEGMRLLYFSFARN
ncbi:hypothetical protein L7F22_063725 [Adiantum nelumboides]|nr:hypothetical protein [Adiantum nelumboides]